MKIILKEVKVARRVMAKGVEYFLDEDDDGE